MNIKNLGEQVYEIPGPELGGVALAEQSARLAAFRLTIAPWRRHRAQFPDVSKW
jgi:hypothetical protein